MDSLPFVEPSICPLFASRIPGRPVCQWLTWAAQIEGARLSAREAALWPGLSAGLLHFVLGGGRRGRVSVLGLCFGFRGAGAAGFACKLHGWGWKVHELWGFEVL